MQVLAFSKYTRIGNKIQRLEYKLEKQYEEFTESVTIINELHTRIQSLDE